MLTTFLVALIPAILVIGILAFVNAIQDAWLQDIVDNLDLDLDDLDV